MTNKSQFIIISEVQFQPEKETWQVEKSQTVFVVILEGRHILLVENPAESIPGGHYKEQGWGLPGGKMKESDGGSQNKTACREVKEETGLILDEGKIGYLGHESKGTHIVWLVTAPTYHGSLRTDFRAKDILNVQWATFRLTDGDLSFEIEEEGKRKSIFVYRAHRKRIMRALGEFEKKSQLKLQHAF